MTKRPITQQQYSNLKEALEVMWPSVPPANVSPRLGRWRVVSEEEYRSSIARGFKTPPDCGTICCFGGWCAWWPNFRAQGVSVGYEGYPVFDDGAWPMDEEVVCSHLFGWETLFRMRGNSPIDRNVENEPCMSDHEFVKRRLQYALDNSEVTK